VRQGSQDTGPDASADAEVAVRPAAPDDLPALVTLLGTLFSLEADFEPDPARQRRGLAALLAARDRARVLVAELEGAVVGMVTGQLVVSTAEGGPSAWVEDLVVDEGARGAGAGRALLEVLSAWARERGASRLQLLVDEENLPALAFYQRMGWGPTQLRALRRRP
jgi:ribosomal protein S18 acetylase RimI-like enzyme